MLPKIFFILGQTASGKTARAVALAKSKDGELINCDSRQIYRELNIITGKADNPADIPVHLVDIVDVGEPYSPYEFAFQGIEKIKDIISRGKVPIIVGGTGNYARMLMYMDPKIVNDAPSSLRSAKQRSNLIQKWDCRVVPATTELLAMTDKRELQRKLMQLDKDVFNQLNLSDKENPRRLIRAIQRSESSTGDLLDLDSPHALANQYAVEVTILLHKDQESLQARISQRVDERLQSGAVEECQSLLAKGYKSTDLGLATIGYQTIFRHLAGVIDYETMKSEWAIKERQYAKRQKTYLLKYFPEAKIVLV